MNCITINIFDCNKKTGTEVKLKSDFIYLITIVWHNSLWSQQSHLYQIKLL